jgi:hypothetical protein
MPPMNLPAKIRLESVGIDEAMPCNIKRGWFISGMMDDPVSVLREEGFWQMNKKDRPALEFQDKEDF